MKRTWLHAYILDPLERAGSTFVEQLSVLLVPYLVVSAGFKLAHVPWLSTLDVAGFAALASLATSVLTFGIPVLPQGWDLVLRVVKTGVQSFVGVVFAAGVTPSVVHAHWTLGFATAIPTALAALVKGLASTAAPWSVGASLLPASKALYSVVKAPPPPATTEDVLALAGPPIEDDTAPAPAFATGGVIANPAPPTA
jgi:hypothetical protein